jgi:hypothetical protein
VRCAVDHAIAAMRRGCKHLHIQLVFAVWRDAVVGNQLGTKKAAVLVACSCSGTCAAGTTCCGSPCTCKTYTPCTRKTYRRSPPKATQLTYWSGWLAGNSCARAHHTVIRWGLSSITSGITFSISMASPIRTCCTSPTNGPSFPDDAAVDVVYTSLQMVPARSTAAGCTATMRGRRILRHHHEFRMAQRNTADWQFHQAHWN